MPGSGAANSRGWFSRMRRMASGWPDSSALRRSVAWFLSCSRLGREGSDLIMLPILRTSSLNANGYSLSSAHEATEPTIPAMKTSLFLAGLVTWSVLVKAEVGAPLPLWPEGAPGALGKEDKDVPSITPYSPEPDKATGAALVVCPGGGYGGLAPHEGRDYALWLNGHGVAVFVLKYRLGSGGYRHPAMLSDAARALRLVRAKAADWKIDPHRVGIMGSSAGGHLASTLLTHFDSGNPAAEDPIERQSSRPDI